MSLTMHAATAPGFTRMLTNMLVWLDKAQAHAEARRFDAGNYLGLRLAPDMLPLTRQVQIACDGAKGCMARLAGIEVPRWDDTESTLDELRARIRRTRDYVSGFTPEQLAGSQTREIIVPTRTAELRFSGEDYVRHFVLPNFYFHATTTYALLRHAGVDIGKRDYLG
jgi:hypothetical protein